MGMWRFLLQAPFGCFLFVSETYMHLHVFVLPNLIDIQIVRAAEGNFPMSLSKILGQCSKNTYGT